MSDPLLTIPQIGDHVVKSVPLPDAPPQKNKRPARIRDFHTESFMNCFGYFPILVIHTEDELTRAKEIVERVRANQHRVDGENEYLELLELVVAHGPATIEEFRTRPTAPPPPREVIDPLSTIRVVPIRPIPTIAEMEAMEGIEPFHAPPPVADAVTDSPAEPQDGPGEADGPVAGYEPEEISEQAKADLATISVQPGVPEPKYSKKKGRK